MHPFLKKDIKESIKQMDEIIDEKDK